MSEKPAPETTPAEKRIIVVHDCALELLELPVEDRRVALEAIHALVLSPAGEKPAVSADPAPATH